MVAVRILGRAVTTIGGFSEATAFDFSFLEFFNEKRKLERREKKLFFRFFGGASKSARCIDRGNDEDEFVDDVWGMMTVLPFVLLLRLLMRH